MDITPGTLAALEKRYDKIYQSAFTGTTVLWQKFAQRVPSTTLTEVHTWMDRVPQLREWIGARVVQNATLRSQTITNRHFELTEGLNRDRISDNIIGSFDGLVQMMAERAKKLPDVLLLSPAAQGAPGPLANGQNAPCYDGQDYFSTAHPQNMDNPASPTFSNYFSSGYPLNPASFVALRQVMRSYRGADGLPLYCEPTHVVVPPALEEAAIQTLKTEWISPAAAFGAVAAAAPSKNSLFGAADVIVADDLAGDDTRWYMLDNSHPIKPFIYQDREAPKFAMRVRPDDPAVFDMNVFKYGVDLRGNGGYGPWFYAISAQA